jgi:hypothetical protein
MTRVAEVSVSFNDHGCAGLAQHAISGCVQRSLHVHLLGKLIFGPCRTGTASKGERDHGYGQTSQAGSWAGTIGERTVAKYDGLDGD